MIFKLQSVQGFSFARTGYSGCASDKSACSNLRHQKRKLLSSLCRLVSYFREVLEFESFLVLSYDSITIVLASPFQGQLGYI